MLARLVRILEVAVGTAGSGGGSQSDAAGDVPPSGASGGASEYRPMYRLWV